MCCQSDPGKNRAPAARLTRRARRPDATIEVRTMKQRRSNPFIATAAAVLAALATTLLASAARAHGTREAHPPFSYAGGTEPVPENCAGQLEVTQDNMVFRCAEHSIVIPLSSVTLMQYRPDVSHQVLRLKLRWRVEVRPPDGSNRKNENRYFAIVYAENGTAHAVVLEVEPLDMRPYLAEIEMKSGRRVQVMGYAPYGY